MILRRTGHVMIGVGRERLESAVSFYKTALGLREGARQGGAVGLEGDNFTLWVTEKGHGLVLQELAPEQPDGVREHLLAQGCRPIEVDGETSSGEGFYVEDPYGLRFHVYTGAGRVRREVFPEGGDAGA